jgi:diguanylate cyclase (GGDEF)-like protein/PAS domain S-box-containing protein
MDQGVVNQNLVSGLVFGDLVSYLSGNHRFFWKPFWGSSALSQGGFFADAGWLNLLLALGGLVFLLALGRFFYLRWRGQLAVLTSWRKRESSNQSEDRLRAIFEFAPDAYYLSDLMGTFVDGNQAAEELVGYPREVLIGQSFLSLDLLPRDELPRAAALLAKNVQGKATGPDEFTIKRKDGTYIMVEIKTFPVKIEGQALVLGIARDVTERNRVAGELERIKEFNEDLIQSVEEGIVVVADDETLSFVNPAAAKMMGYLPEELIGQHWHVVIPEDQHPIVEAADARRAQGISDRYELELVHKDGSRVPVVVSGAPRYAEGRFAGSLAVFTDVSAIRSTEVELLKLSNAVEASGDAVFMTDKEGLITYINPGFTRLYGYKAEDVVGEVTPRILKSGEMDPEDYVHFWETLLNKEVVRGELINKTKDGRLIHVTGSANPILDTEGQIIGFLAIQRDISERVRMEEAERAARELAERRASELEVLERVAETLNQAELMDDPLEPALATLMGLVGAEAGWILLLEPDDSTRLAGVRGLPPELAEEDYAAFRSSGCVCQQMLLAGELTEGVILFDCERLSAANSGRGAYPRNHATIPLRVGGKVLGNLNLVAGSGRDFTEGELRLLTAAGDQFGVAVERAQLFGEVQQLAVTDSLTGLNNRRHLFVLAEHEFERAQRYANPLAIMMLDLDFFKRVNDTYGHAIGDHVLCMVAERCAGNLREVDILGRYGGEEFVVLLPETNLASASIVAERLCRLIGDEPIKTEKGPVSVTVSLGVAPLDDACESFDALLERADQALYAAKENGRNQVAVWGEKP